MAKAFKSTPRGITARLEPAERELLRKFFADLIEMLEPRARPDEDPLWAMVGLDAAAEVPEDPALLRLLPAGIRNDDAEALEFRRLTERSLREAKVQALRSSSLLLETDPLVLNVEQAQVFSRAVNDVRLVLAERLGIESEEDAERLHEVDNWSKAEDIDSYLALVYNFLTWLQEALMQALLSTLQRPGRGRKKSGGAL